MSFSDPDFVGGGRETIYYVRAIQEPTPAVNAASMRCEGGRCENVTPCYGDYRTPYDEDCLAYRHHFAPQLQARFRRGQRVSNYSVF